jgi:hypothetical protein
MVCCNGRAEEEMVRHGRPNAVGIAASPEDRYEQPVQLGAQAGREIRRVQIDNPILTQGQSSGRG